MSPDTAPALRRRVHHPSGAPAGQVRFAHPSERLFAGALDLYEERWEYEPVEFPLRWDEHGSPVSGFRPDFWLPERGLFIELTTAEQRLVTRKNGKVRRMRELDPEVPVLVVYSGPSWRFSRRTDLISGYPPPRSLAA